MAAMAEMLIGVSMGSSYQRKRPMVNIPDEYELIQNKQSKLCRADRDWVERMFNSNYTKVEDNG